ncbi:MAG: hypothetical protein ACYC6Y_21550 [Thermoguttaceae bacterium]
MTSGIRLIEEMPGDGDAVAQVDFVEIEYDLYSNCGDLSSAAKEATCLAASCRSHLHVGSVATAKISWRWQSGVRSSGLRPGYPFVTSP